MVRLWLKGDLVEQFKFKISGLVCHFTALRKASFASAVYATANPSSVRPSVCLSVRHTPVLCHNEGTQRDAVFTIG